MRWKHALYVHWIVPPDTLVGRLPRGVRLDPWHGDAVVSLVAIDVEGPAPRRLLDTALAPLFRYRQLNLRTYVIGAQGPGMTLLETRVDRFTYALGARLAGIPYHLDRRLSYAVAESAVALSARGLELHGTIDVGPAAPMAPGTLEAFADERYLAYAALPAGRTLCVQVAHPPWRARPVRLAAPVTPEALGLPVAVPPASAQLCEDVEVVVEHVAAPAEEVEAPVLAPA